MGVWGAPLSGTSLNSLGVPDVGSNSLVLREKFWDLSSLFTVGHGAVGAVYDQTVSQCLLAASW